MTTPHAPGTWYLAPADNTDNEYAAGYDGNTFATQAEAEAEIPSLQACGEQFAATEWVAVQRPAVRDWRALESEAWDRLQDGETAAAVAADLGLEERDGVVILPGWCATDGYVDQRGIVADSGRQAAEKWSADGDWDEAGEIQVRACRVGLRLEDGKVVEHEFDEDWHTVAIGGAQGDANQPPRRAHRAQQP